MVPTSEEVNMSLKELRSKPANLLVPVVLFLLLVPGVLLNVELSMKSPYVKVSPGLLAKGALPNSLQSLLVSRVGGSVNSVVVHAVVFAAVYFYLRTSFRKHY